MSIKKFIVWARHTCQKAFRTMSTSLQSKVTDDKPRGSVSTEITLLEFDGRSCCHPRDVSMEALDNSCNENLENRWKSATFLCN